MTVSGKVTTTDAWSEPVAIRPGRSITLLVGGGLALVQFARQLPPQPAVFSDDAILVNVGEWSHAEPFGWFRFKSAQAGTPATVTYSAYS